MNPKEPERVRLDKWLWAARFFKTRALSAEAIDKGRVTINGQLAKASREPQVGHTIEFRMGNELRTVVVKGLSAVRGPAPVAQQLYEETPESVARRLATAEQRRLAPEPALSQPMGRPTKRDRRTLNDWGDRWSASLDDENG
ncbi:MAG: RNA-binding S4 domain-containing protein [Hydrogenophaga sp.]|nr:RNA-binding S4 domain-containing protein [Hydrogenophaga sp.]